MTHRRRRRGHYTLPDLLITAVGGLIIGAVFAHVALRLTTAQAQGAMMGPERMLDHVTTGFPEAYRDFMRLTMEQDPALGLIPAEARFMVPSSRFDLNADEEASAIAALEETFSSAPKLTRLLMGQRVRDLAEAVAPESAVRCEDYTVGPERIVRWPEWRDQRVREVVIEFNIGC